MSYNKWQFNSMRQDAIRRSNEMYRKSSADYKKNSYIKLHESDNIIHDTTEKSQNEPLPVNQSGSNGLLSILSANNIDTEKLIIIALIYLLLNEKADMKIIGALIYLLL